MSLRPYSSALLAFCGLILIGIGLYFVFLRPALLPEDTRYIGMPLPELRSSIPGLFGWLEKVFWVMGGYICTTGLLTVYVALTSFRSRARGVSGVAALAGLTSVGWMTIVNLVIGSDFKWLLLAFAALWSFALVLYWFEKRQDL
ncbi:MAG: hypothetical protein M3Q54_06075 [Actinomycetota bacterium]|jgi:hypothetical protein|nr:hypothetical protein [Rubrobacter sp.]MBA3790432.1 hypothetical protein [Rubrobacter sp.]MDQ3237088.1 hypothetical protein [Actinomycetota bacterium]